MSGFMCGFAGFVGIDVSKDKFDACGIRSDEAKLFQFSATMDRKGFDKLKGHLAAVSISSVLIGMESTASYHVNLFSYLVSEGYNVILINPLLVSSYVKMQLRKTKTDKNLLNITFPELEHMTGIFTKAILKLLLRYPSAHSLKGVDLGHLTQMLIADSQGRKRDAFAEDLLKAAQSSIATDSPAKDMILRQNIMLLLYLEDALEEITDMLIEMSRNLMEEDINILTSIKGIGDKAAATFLIEMGGSINQFERSGKIIAMAGLDPSVYQSGKHEGKGKITKRGNRHLRKIIWLMTTKVIQYTDIFNVYYLKRRKEGLPYKMAVLATAHKLIRVVYAMLTQRTTFSLQVNS